MINTNFPQNSIICATCKHCLRIRNAAGETAYCVCERDGHRISESQFLIFGCGNWHLDYV